MNGRPIPSPLLCFCGELMKLKDSRFGPFYGCTEWPSCEGTAAIHSDGSLKSTPADKETKVARIEAHKYFDRAWKEGLVSRTRAYKLLAEHMGLERRDTHIGYFTTKQCSQVLQFVRDLAREEDHVNEFGPPEAM